MEPLIFPISKTSNIKIHANLLKDEYRRWEYVKGIYYQRESNAFQRQAHIRDESKDWRLGNQRRKEKEKGASKGG